MKEINVILKYIDEVVCAGSPAETAGIKPGDLIAG